MCGEFICINGAFIYINKGLINGILIRITLDFPSSYGNLGYTILLKYEAPYPIIIDPGTGPDPFFL